MRERVADLRRQQRRVLGFGAASLVAVVVLGLGLPAAVMWLETPQQALVLREVSVELPPEPRLQVAPQNDYQRYLERQREALDDWRTVGREVSPEVGQARARIPLDVAIEIMSQRGGWQDRDETE